ncbi:putative dynein heavy chain fragment [Phakopsora pachyrhizi]|nr:putative dynein heavy chain fragment [Phakopsora pachyrhizi]KAI8444408.1 putative dynein heavy chain fragment [Phakopsora pachyrhizi]
MNTIAGNALLLSDFMTYGGFFDQSYCEAMWEGWAYHLNQANLKYTRHELSQAKYLSTAGDQLGWQSKSLSPDNLCTENVIMLKRFNLCPLVKDPLSKTTNFQLNEYKDRKMTVKSFLDEAFLKSLKSALRFGTLLLIQDFENLVPILKLEL